MNAMEFFKRSLIFLGLLGLLFSVVGGVLVYVYQDQLVSRFVDEANKRIATPIHADKIKASWWKKFPDVSIVLTDVVIDGSLPGPTDTLARADNIYCTFNAWEILRGNWIVDEIHMKKGMLFLVQSELGDNNYTIVNRKNPQSDNGSGFKLEKIELTDVSLTYLDLLRTQEYQLKVHDVTASLASDSSLYQIELEGDITSEKLEIASRKYFQDQPVNINAQLSYHQPEKRWNIQRSELSIDGSSFLVNGFYQGLDNSVELAVEGHNTNIKTILSLLPQQIASKFDKYQSRGELYFSGRLAGSMEEGEDLEARIDFGCRNASFDHPRYEKGMEAVYLSGSFYSPQVGRLDKATLTLKDVKGTLEGRNFAGNLQINNLEQYRIKGDFQGTFSLNSWQKFLPPGEVTTAEGNMEVDITFEGPVNYLKSTTSMDKFKTSGEILIEDLSFSLANNSLPFKNFNGHFMFNGRDLAISGFSGNIGHSDFQLNGYFRNIIAFIFSKNQPIGIEADLKAETLDFDELLTGSTRAPETTVMGKQTYTSFEINPRLALLFDCKVNELKFRRFRGHDIKGKLSIANQVAEGTRISFNTMGGNIVMNGMVDGRIQDHIRVNTNSSYQGIHIDSLFHVFENFGQDFLVDDHLKGQVDADLVTYMAFDNYLRFKSPDLVVNAGLTIQNGELNNFEPLQKLSPYLDSEDLKHLEFADLKNSISIKDREIFLPNMVVQSNLTTIAVNGTHTFDQEINYRLKVPIQRSQKDKDEYFGAIEDDGLSTNLFLKIVGTTSEYQVVYDKDAVKKKIKQDLREEKWEFRQAVQNKGTDTEAQELDQDDYFDFDEPDSTLTKKPQVP
jgi:hypothetical protein